MLNFRKLFRTLSCFGTASDPLEPLVHDPHASPIAITDAEWHPARGSLGSRCLDIQTDDQRIRRVPDLPIELLNAILLYSSDHDLCQVAKCNAICLAVATRLLYREIELMYAVKIVRCLKTLSRRPDTALYVRKLHVSDDLANGSEVLPSFYKLLHKALRQMHNLFSLSLLIGGPHSFVLTGCSFRLKSFNTACHWDKPLARWLENQDDITTALFCGKFHHDARISDTALPRLRRISASPLILAAVVPSRPVEEAELCLIHPWLLNSDIISTTLRILAYSSSVVHTLQFITHITDSSEMTLGALRAVPKHLPKLASLAIHVVRGSVTKDVLDGLGSVFSLFTSLQSVMILSKNEIDALHDEEMTNPLAKLWHTSCRSLEIVSFPDSIWVRNPRLGWVTLKDLERILSERERDLEKKEKDLAQREQGLVEREKVIQGIGLVRRTDVTS